MGSDSSVSIEFDAVDVVAAGHRILGAVDLRIPAGTSLGIVGPSGAGKSSLVGLLLGWHRPSRGEIRVNGSQLDQRCLEALRATTAWVDPSVQLWNRELLENVIYGSDSDREGNLMPVVDTALLRRRLESFPEGWQTRLGEGGVLLSGGEGQRVRLARSLLRPGAGLVILDEPFRGLDRPTRRRLLGAARRWWPDATFLVVTHDVEHVRDLDRVVILDEGRIVEEGFPEQLIADPDSQLRALMDMEQDTLQWFEKVTPWRRFEVAGGRLQRGGDETHRRRAGRVGGSETPRGSAGR